MSDNYGTPNYNFHANLHRDGIDHKHNLGDTISIADNNPHTHPDRDAQPDADTHRNKHRDGIKHEHPHGDTLIGHHYINFDRDLHS